MIALRINAINQPITVCTPEVLESMVGTRFAMKKMVVLPNSGHWPHIDSPSDVAREIEEFIESPGREQ